MSRQRRLIRLLYCVAGVAALSYAVDTWWLGALAGLSFSCAIFLTGEQP